MTDAELIALLEQKTPQELSLEEIDLLRRRLSESEELRQTLLDQLQMETYLAEALSRIELSPEKIVARAAQQQPSPAGSTLLIALLIGLPLLALVSVVLMNTLGPGGGPLADMPDALAPTAANEKGAAGGPKVEQPALDKAKGKESEPKEKTKTEQPLVANPPEAKANAAPPPPAGPPWQAALDAPGEPPYFKEIAFEPYSKGFDVPGKDDLTPWLERVPGTNLRLTKGETQYGRTGVFEGLARLKCPWPADGVLRVQLENYNRLRLHFFHELVGVTLIYYEDQSYRWVAYATTRETGKGTPKNWAITASDDDRCRRSEMRYGGPLELRYRDGELILSRGDIVLLAAPLPGAPTDAYFEGRAAVQGIALVRARGEPLCLPQPLAAVEIERPADLAWTTSKPDAAKLEPLPDGALRLAADNTKQRTECVTLLSQKEFAANGIHECILELSDITPGTGVYLGREGGKPLDVVRFFHDRKSGQLAAKLQGWDDQWQIDLENIGDKPVPLVQPKCWVRMLFGCGLFRWWLSADGEHWAEPEMARDSSPPVIDSIGLQAVGNRPDTHLTLRRITLRRLAGISDLAKAELVSQAPIIIDGPSPGAWLAAALRDKPAEAETADWLRACSVKTLAAGVHRDLSHPLLEALLDDAVRRGLPLAEQLAALDDAMLLATDLRDGEAMRIGLSNRYARLGVWAGDVLGEPAWSSVRQHYQAAPQYTWLLSPINLDQALRFEVVRAAYRGTPAETLDLVRTLRFYQQHRDRGLVEWVESLAARSLPAQAGEAAARLKDSWREPLIEELSKETYNAMTELRAVLESQAWDDAGRLVTSLDPQTAPGVAPYVNDKTLLTSLPVAVRLTLEEYPQLRESLGEQFAALARLRIGQAVAQGDAAAIELATVQFAGTEAAAEAHQWLGDRALAGGAFTRALLEYERAGQSDPALAGAIAPRIRLAAAMLGRDQASPVTAAVQFGDMSLSAAEFEALVVEMRARGQSQGLAAAQSASVPVPPPSGFTAEVRSKLDGPTGERPQEEVGRRTNQFRVPWADRQIATVVDGDTLYVSNRFQVAAYNLKDGKRLWQSQNPPGTMQRAQDWAMIPMRPLVVGDRIFVRLLYSANPLLVCLEKSSGKLLWIAENRDREFLVSDPLLVQGQLVALGIVVQQEQQGQLRWCQYDPQTGEMLRHRDLVRLRDTWGARSCCEVTPLPDGLVAALGGVTLAVDSGGTLRWARTHVSLPSDEDLRWVLQMYQPPLALGERMYVAQPGVRTVECLSTTSGRRYWSAVLPEVVGIVGMSGERLIVRTEAGLRALNTADGQTQWRYDAGELFSFQLVDDKWLLVASREKLPRQNDRWQVRLTWLDPASGQAVATTELPYLTDNDPRLGPLVPYKDRLFTFYGRGQHDPVREIVELVPSGQADRAAVPSPTDPWRQRLPEEIARATFDILGDWQLVSSAGGDRTGRALDVHGEKQVLGLRHAGPWPVTLARELTVPMQGRPRLRLRLCTDAGQQWRIEVRHGEKLLKSEDIKDETHKDRWNTIEVDLAPAAGTSGWLTITARSQSGDHVLWWKDAEILF